MNEDIVKKLEDFIGELDHLYQEGVVFNTAEYKSLYLLTDQLWDLLNNLNVK